MNKIDYRKKSQYINIGGHKVYIWVYKKENYIAYGIQGTSFHNTINDYKNFDKNEIIHLIRFFMKREGFLYEQI